MVFFCRIILDNSILETDTDFSEHGEKSNFIILCCTSSVHSTHFQVGGNNPKIEGQEFSSLHQGPVKGPFIPNEKYAKIMQNS